MRFPVGFLAAGLVAAALGGCASSPERYQEALTAMADDLCSQLEVRTDLRHLRVFVYEFEACAAPEERHRGWLAEGHSEEHFRRRLRHHLMSVLAPRVPILDSPAADYYARLPSEGGGARSDVFPGAKELGATAALVGNYSVVGEDTLLLMARLVDVETKQVLAAADRIVTGVDVPHHHRGR